MLDQPDFLNLVVTGSTSLSPTHLLARLQTIETAFGRDRSKERLKGPRTLDIDILLYANEVITSPELIIPHPGIKERAFVIVPLVEIAPDLRHPIGGETLAVFAASLSGQGIYLHADPPV
ncbi:hypothetical protein MASR2M48_02630 [Spirochaetota bacterium]